MAVGQTQADFSANSAASTLIRDTVDSINTVKGQVTGTGESLGGVYAANSSTRFVSSLGVWADGCETIIRDLDSIADRLDEVDRAQKQLEDDNTHIAQPF